MPASSTSISAFKISKLSCSDIPSITSHNPPCKTSQTKIKNTAKGESTLPPFSLSCLKFQILSRRAFSHSRALARGSFLPEVILRLLHQELRLSLQIPALASTAAIKGALPHKGRHPGLCPCNAWALLSSSLVTSPSSSGLRGPPWRQRMLIFAPTGVLTLLPAREQAANST